MTDAPATVGDLDPDREVIRFAHSSTKVHLPEADCPTQRRKNCSGTRKRAAVLFNDTEICPTCRPGEHTDRGKGGPAILPTDTEVRRDV